MYINQTPDPVYNYEMFVRSISFIVFLVFMKYVNSRVEFPKSCNMESYFDYNWCSDEGSELRSLKKEESTLTQNVMSTYCLIKTSQQSHAHSTSAKCQSMTRIAIESTTETIQFEL